MRSFLRAGAALIALALMVTTVGLGSAESATAAVPTRSRAATGSCHAACRVLIISLPATSWGDVSGARLPHLDQLLAHSAIAGLATRSVHQRTTPGDGYVTLGTGTRSVGAGFPGQNLAPREPYGNATAAQVFARRNGVALGDNIGVMSISSIIDANNGLPYDASAALLGTTLSANGVGRAVIANADEDELEAVADRYHREAALGLMDASGRVPSGRVDNGLLETSPASPFGLRLNPNAVMAEFTKVWDQHERNVVLVEASDLARADAYRGFARPQQRAAMRLDALHAADRLVGQLLTHVDPSRDVVMVLSPYHSALRREVTVAAVRGPGLEPGFLRSATTRRTGFVQIVDVAPTILAYLGIQRPTKMEGRPFEVDATSASYDSRVSTIVRANRAAVFRDSNIGKATGWLLTLTLVLAGAALLIFRRRLVGATHLLELAALALPGFLVATFVSGLLPFYKSPSNLYFLFLVGFALVYGAIGYVLGRRHPADGLLFALGGMVLLHLFDALSGARLEFNTVFGYTPTIGIRLAGLGNPGSAQLCAAALLFAALIAWRVGAPTGRRIAVAVLLFTVVVVGAPFFGQDFGGAISAAPAYLLLALLLYGKRITKKAVALLGVVLVGAGLAVGFVDLMRPADSRTHVGRFFEKVRDEGLSGFTTVIGRKLSLMIATFHDTGWLLLVVGVLGSLAYLAWRTDRLRVLADRVPTLRPALISFAVLAALATLLNDSGIQVMGMMLTILVPTLIVLASRELVPPERGPEPGPDTASGSGSGSGSVVSEGEAATTPVRSHA